MTVADLIEKLSKYDKNLVVVVVKNDGEEIEATTVEHIYEHEGEYVDDRGDDKHGKYLAIY